MSTARFLFTISAVALLLTLLAPGGVSAPAHLAHRSAGGLALSADPTSGPAPLLVAFNLTLPNGTPPTLAWSFGDGEYWNGSGLAFLHPGHEYLRAGVYTATITARWGSEELQASVPIRALVTNLSATLAINPLDGPAPLNVEFQAYPVGGSGTYVSFLWQFGDGTAGQGPRANHTYAQPGTFEVNLTVTDSAQRTARGSARVTVTSPASGDRNSSGPGTGSGPGPSSSSSVPSVGPLVAGLVGGGLGALAAGAGWVAWQRRKRSFAKGTGPGEVPARAIEPTPSPRPRLTQVAAGLALPDLRPGPMPMPSGSPARGPAAPVGASAAGLGPAPVPNFAEARQLTQRLLRHLASLPRLGLSDLPTQEWTQAGMASTLGVGLSAVSKILRRLEAAGIVSAETGHAIGSSRRVRIYRLTPRGERLGQALREAGPPWSAGGADGRRSP